MKADNKRKGAKMVEDEGWTSIWVGEKMPNQFLDEKVMLLYEDMDGYPAVCEAIYTYDRGKFNHRPYCRRVSDGARMGNVIAWK